jgi:two-component system, OmpR family, response regulator
MRILIIEDDAVLADGLIRSLGQAGYAVDHAAQGEDADHMLSYQTYDLAILDLGLPKLNGFEVLKRLRQRDSKTPVLILTARDGITDRVNGLDLGADDYLTKPFDLIELEARIRALIRRGQSGGSAQLELGRLKLDTAGRLASVDEQSLDLSARELAVLEILMLKIGRVVNKEQIMERLCNWEDDIGDNAIEVYVHRLRKKLKGSHIEIKTIRGLGYLLEKPAAKEHGAQ